jgi:hypothetical protein
MDEPLPAVDAIMNEIRRGLEDTSLSDATAAAIAANCSLQADIRKAAATAGVLGRCGGSLRGRVCRLLAPLALPVIEQLDLFHAAAVSVLSSFAGLSNDHAATAIRVGEIERRLQTLEAKAKSGARDGEPQ